MKENAYTFWKRLDESYNGTLKELCLKTGVDYNRVKRNRSDCRLPNLEDAYALSHEIGLSIETLLTGKSATMIYNVRIRTIAKACEKASEIELQMVEKILDIPPVGKNTEIHQVIS